MICDERIHRVGTMGWYDSGYGIGWDFEIPSCTLSSYFDSAAKSVTTTPGWHHCYSYNATISEPTFPAPINSQKTSQTFISLSLSLSLCVKILWSVQNGSMGGVLRQVDGRESSMTLYWGHDVNKASCKATDVTPTCNPLDQANKIAIHSFPCDWKHYWIHDVWFLLRG